MKRFLPFIALLALLLSSFSLGHALTVTIGGGTATTPVFPISGTYNYSYTQQIYTRAQINRAGEISKIRFYYVSGSIANNKDWAILMGHTTKTAFSSNSDWVPSASLTSVFSGDVTSMVPSSAGWMEITLTTPFNYNNTDNLVIAVWQPTAGSSNMNWGAFTSGSNTGMFYRNNTTVPPPNNPPSASGRTSDINRIQLEFPEDVAPLAPQLTAPASGAEVYAGMSLSWTLPAGSTPATGYDVYLDGNLVSSNQAASSYKLPGTLSLGTHTWYVKARNAYGVSPASLTRSFQRISGFVIGDQGSSQASPFNVVYGYHRSLGLYTPAQMGQLGSITSLGWNVHTPKSTPVPYKIYAMFTTQTALEKMTWAEVTTGATLLKEGTAIFDTAGWHTISLDTPFNYAGGNLLIGVEVNYGGNGAGSGNYPTFYYTNSTPNSYQYWRKDGSAPTDSGILATYLPDLLMQFSPLPAEPVLSLSPAAWDFGNRPINTVSSKMITIMNTGSASLNLTGFSTVYPGAFSVSEAPAFPLTLATGETASFRINFGSDTAMEYTETFTLNHTEGSASITVSGSCYDPTIVSFPYLQNFDGEWTGTPAAPTDWQVINANNDGYTWRRSNSGISPTHSSPYAAQGAGNTDDWLISPPINLSNINARLRWWDKVESASYPSSYKVMISTTTPEISSFSTVLAYITCNTTDWTERRLDLNWYSGHTIYLAFHQYASAGSNYGFGIDDFLLEEMPPVLANMPSNINFGMINANTGTLHGEVTVFNNGGGTLSLTEADISIIGDDAAMFSFGTDNLPFVLTANQCSRLKVCYRPTAVGTHTATLRMVYAGANHDVALIGQGLGEFAFRESFEGELFPPYGWTVHNGGDIIKTWERSTFFPHAGLAHALIQAGPGGADDWLITPKLAPTGENHTFSFYAAVPNSSCNDRFNVKVSTTTADIASFTHTLATDVQPSLGYTLYSYDLTEFIGQNIYVAIHDLATGYTSLCVDDVSGPDLVPFVPPAPVLQSPEHAATWVSCKPTLTWSSDSAIVTGYKVYCDTNFPPTTEVADVTTPEFTFATALNPETNYYWTVKAYNSEGCGQPAAPFSFTTRPQNWVQIGTGNEFNSSTVYPAVYGGYYRNAREQYIFTADELIAAGAQAGLLTSICFNVHATHGCSNLANFTIRMAATDLTEFEDYSFFTGLTEVYSVTSYTPTDGWNTHTFSTPFSWDGSSNLVIQASFDLQASSSLNASTYSTTTAPARRTLYYYSDYNAWQDEPEGYRYSTRPNVRLQYLQPMSAPPAAPILSYPADNAVGLPKEGFNLNWAPDFSNGGVPDYYAVYLSTDPANMQSGYRWETNNTRFNPVLEDNTYGFSFVYEQCYYWTVEAINSLGTSPAATPRSFEIETDSIITTYPWTEVFDSANIWELPTGWTSIASNAGDDERDWLTIPYFFTGFEAHSGDQFAAVAYHENLPKDEWMITPPCSMQAGQIYRIGFHVLAPSYEDMTYEALAFHWGTEPTVAAMTGNTALYDNPQMIFEDWGEVSVYFTAPATDSYYFGWHAYSQADMDFIGVDTVTISGVYDNDLAVLALSGADHGSVGSALNLNVSVENRGSVAQSNYTVYLKEQVTGAVLAQVQIADTINPDEIKQHTLSWIPGTAGTLSVYAEVALAGDEDSGNDVSAPKEIIILPEGTASVYVGDPNTSASSVLCPFGLIYEDFVAETIYLASEIMATNGTIQAISYYNDFDTAQTFQAQIWMKNTAATSLSDGWLPWDGYQLVFDGDIVCPAGENEITIFLTTPFSYTGGNLATRTSKTWEDDWEADQFWLVTYDSNYPERSRTHEEDGNPDFDHTNPPEVQPNSDIPNITFLMTDANLVATLAAPVVDVTITDTGALLEWAPNPYAYGYKVYAAADPYSFGDEPAATVYTNSAVLALPTADKGFFKVVASNDYGYSWTGGEKLLPNRAPKPPKPMDKNRIQKAKSEVRR